MNDLIDVQRNSDGSLTITIAQPMADVLVSGFLQTAKQLQVQQQQVGNDPAPLTAPARLRFGGRMKISPTEVCESLGISRRTLANWQRRHVIPYYKVGRRILFDVAEVEHALRRFRCIAVGESRPRKRRMERVQYEP
jgi:excisionase family DNA binding protein